MKILWCVISTNIYLNTSGHLFYLYGQTSRGKCIVAFYQRKINQNARAISSSRNCLPRLAGDNEVWGQSWNPLHCILFLEGVGSSRVIYNFPVALWLQPWKKRKKQSVWTVLPMYSQQLTNPHVITVFFFQFTTNEAGKKKFRKQFFDRAFGFCVTLLPI